MRLTISGNPATQTLIIMRSDKDGNVIFTKEYDPNTTLKEVVADVWLASLPVVPSVSLPLEASP